MTNVIPLRPRRIPRSVTGAPYIPDRIWQAIAPGNDFASDRARLRHLSAGGELGQLVAVSVCVSDACLPAEREWMLDRLSELYQFIGSERGVDGATAWLATMLRLLHRFPADIVHRAIDQAVLDLDRWDLPTPKAISSIATTMFAERIADSIALDRLVRASLRASLSSAHRRAKAVSADQTNLPLGIVPATRAEGQR
ncbi:hypothetical protein ACFSGX_07835 [Sphingomonas arantia]|uniref:Uncharacterized protein n=1 Tax=Sphingomonas arantia TaxID=1460676 RepID=A0ABW4TVD5_9SPHN